MAKKRDYYEVLGINRDASDDEKKQIEDAIKAVEDSIRGNDKAEIEAKTEMLGTAAQKLGEKMYAQQQAQAGAEGAADGQPGAQPGAQGKKDEGDVVDAEFTEVPKDKK